MCGRVHPSIRPRSLSTGENESLRVRKTGPNSVGLLRPRSPNLAVLRAAPLVPACLHHPAQRSDPPLQPDLKIGERAPPVWPLP